MGTLYKNGIPYGGGGGGGGTTNALTSSDVVDNLESIAANLPLSANQGKILNEKMLQIVSFDETTGTLITKSSDYMG